MCQSHLHLCGVIIIHSYSQIIGVGLKMKFKNIVLLLRLSRLCDSSHLCIGVHAPIYLLSEELHIVSEVGTFLNNSLCWQKRRICSFQWSCAVLCIQRSCLWAVLLQGIQTNLFVTLCVAHTHTKDFALSVCVKKHCIERRPAVLQVTVKQCVKWHYSQSLTFIFDGFDHTRKRNVYVIWNISSHQDTLLQMYLHQQNLMYRRTLSKTGDDFTDGNILSSQLTSTGKIKHTRIQSSQPAQGKMYKKLIKVFHFLQKRTEQTLQQLLKSLRSFVQSLLIKCMKHLSFRQQGNGETIETYVSVLRKMAKSCNFDVQENSMIRDRLVMGIKDD